MRTFVATILLAMASVAVAGDSDIVNGLENLRRIHRVAVVFELRDGNAAGIAENDPWGTPYRIDAEHRRIVGAGSDRKFDESAWSTNEQFDGLEGDVVFQDGRMFRSNRNWLYARVTAGPSATALSALRASEVLLMIALSPETRSFAAFLFSADAMLALGAIVERNHGEHGEVPRDVWGTPFRLIVEKNHYRIISAGSDRTFSPMTWERRAAADTAEDLIFEDGAFVRQPDANALFAGKALTVKPIAQPLDPARRDRSGIARSGGDVEAPSVLERPEPSYPEYYRQLRLSGIVILECVIAANGSVDDVRVVKSLAPDFDMAATDAVRRWKFSPAMQDGRAIPVLFNLTINFKLR